MDEKNMNKQEETSEKYALYTEKIVQNPKVKYKKYINGFRVVCIVAVAIAVFVLFIKLIIPWYGENFPKKQEQRDELTIEKDEYNDETSATQNISQGQGSLVLTPSESSDTIPEEDDYETIMAELHAKAVEVQKCIVGVDQYSNSVNQLVQEENSATETSGLIIGYVNSEYLIITSASVVGDSEKIVVRFSTGEELQGTVKGRDRGTNIALVGIRAVEMSYTMMQTVKVAKLDNSYNVRQGDVFLVNGKLYGQNKAMDYGTITGVSSITGTDNTFEIFNSNLSYINGDFNFIFNAKGNVIGVSTESTDENLQIIGISDMKSLIEAMANKGGYAYFGIHGHNVNNSLAEMHDFPMGIYVSEVEVDSPAFNAGLQAGDIIYGINGNSILTIQVFSEKLYQCSNGQIVYIKAMRQGKDGYYNVDFNVTVHMK